MSQDQRYALVDGDDVFVCLSSQDLSNEWETAGVRAGYGGVTVRMERVYRGVNRHFGHWFQAPAVDHKAPDVVVVALRERNRVIGYRLADERLRGSVALEISPEEYQARTDNDSADYDPLVGRAYEPVSELWTPEPKLIDGFVRLDGRPWPETDLTWVAKLPYELRYSVEYLHLFPGHIDEGDFRKVVEELLERRADVSYCFSHTGPGLETHVRVGQVTRTIRIPVPNRVAGESFEQALENREEEIRMAIAAVEELSTHVCPTCNGSGTDVPAPAPKPSRRRR